MSQFRQRRLARIVEEMEDLLHNLRREIGMCSQCGAYRTGEIAEQRAADDLTDMLKTVKRWQQEPWSFPETGN